MDQNYIPTAQLVKRFKRPNSKRGQITIICPYCGDEHTHGDVNPTELSHRVSHCHGQPNTSNLKDNGYYLPPIK